MILNVSGRTDVVAFYMKWFMNRLEKGYIDVRNPFYKNQISRIYTKDIELIVFCTKNPIPLLENIDKIKIPFILHVTITPYKKDIEPNVKSKIEIINAVQKIAKIIGKENIYIRYDPIFINNKYNVEYHIKAFQKLISHLEGSTNKIIVSFLDYYKNVWNNIKVLNPKQVTEEDYKNIGIHFSNIAEKCNMTVQTCGENRTLEEYGFIKKDCIDEKLATKLTKNTRFKRWKSRNNKNCHCVEMVDIGVYNSCPHLCKYCYANYDEKSIKQNILTHDENSSLLLGNITQDDIIKIRKK